eukprot:1203418-Rhodomonas_salina.6
MHVTFLEGSPPFRFEGSAEFKYRRNAFLVLSWHSDVRERCYHDRPTTGSVLQSTPSNISPLLAGLTPLGMMLPASPPLPNGLTVDPSTGDSLRPCYPISGTDIPDTTAKSNLKKTRKIRTFCSVTGSPTCQSAQAEYKIRVSNVAGECKPRASNADSAQNTRIQSVHKSQVACPVRLANPTRLVSSPCAISGSNIIAAAVPGCAEFAVSVAVLEKPSGLEYQHGGRGCAPSYMPGADPGRT